MEQHEGCIIKPLLVEQVRVKVNHFNHQVSLTVGSPAGCSVPLCCV